MPPVEEGEELVLMEGSISSVTSRAERVINNAVVLLPENRTPIGVLMIYCAGCRLMVGDEINFMLDSLQKNFQHYLFADRLLLASKGAF